MHPDVHGIFALLAAGAVLITPNKRIALHWQQDYFTHQQQTMVSKPQCLTYSAWLQQLFTEHEKNTASTPLLLSTLQMQQLWVEVLQESLGEHLNSGLVESVKDAWQRCWQWQIKPETGVFQQNSSTRQFQQWSSQMERRLSQLNAISEAQLANYCVENQLKPQEKIVIWLCFDDYTPEQKNIQSLLEQQGCQNLHVDLPEKSSAVTLYTAKDSEDEYQQIVNWLRIQLASQQQRIAVVVPNLDAKALIFQNLLNKHFADEPFNISMGKPFLNYSLVNHAMSFLTFDSDCINRQTAYLLLHTPFISGSKQEFYKRSQALQQHQCIEQEQFPLSAWLPDLSQSTPLLAQVLTQVSAYPVQASVRQWAQLFCQRLQHFGFPGESVLNSENYQCYQRFLGLMEEYCQLQAVRPLMTQEEALTALQNMARNLVFQAQVTSARLHILGLLEASGCRYDSVWVCSMQDETLPQPTRPSSFIPIALQQALHMPYASPERELNLAEKQIRRFKYSANTCVFSYAAFEADKPNLPSPLLIDLPDYSPLENAFPQSEPQLEIWEENYLLPTKADEKTKGTSTLLANQAKCPFRAFAQHRLHAEKKNNTVDGLDNRERGILIHRVMENLWAGLQSQQQLLQINETELTESVQQAIQKALLSASTTTKSSFTPFVQKIEQERLQKMVEASLLWEKQRPDFQIAALEKSFQLNLGDMVFNLRVDRLDTVSDGTYWVLDYKSSLPSPLPWNEDRPQEPQLLLYALLDDKISTLLFSVLKNTQMEAKGLAETAQNSLKIGAIKKTETWTQTRQKWQNNLEKLAQEYLNGHCAPTPLSASTCQQCDFETICRFKHSVTHL